jgi:hypothetical protein
MEELASRSRLREIREAADALSDARKLALADARRRNLIEDREDEYAALLKAAFEEARLDRKAKLTRLRQVVVENLPWFFIGNLSGATAMSIILHPLLGQH